MFGTSAEQTWKWPNARRLRASGIFTHLAVSVGCRLGLHLEPSIKSHILVSFCVLDFHSLGFKNKCPSWAWRYTSVILAPGRLRREDLEFKAMSPATGQPGQHRETLSQKRRQTKKNKGHCCHIPLAEPVLLSKGRGHKHNCLLGKVSIVIIW
jgi:hypothetical protein